MIIQTQYNYEKVWTTTSEQDLLKIIVEEVGNADPKGTLAYIKETIKNGKTISVGSCKFKQGEKNVSK
jgi:hypothetical protein